MQTSLEMKMTKSQCELQLKSFQALWNSAKKASPELTRANEMISFWQKEINSIPAEISETHEQWEDRMESGMSDSEFFKNEAKEFNWECANEV